MSVDRIPAQRSYFGPEDVVALSDVLNSRWTGTGPLTSQLESRIQKLTGAAHVFAVQSGTAALHLALEACVEVGIANPGDKVVVPSQTFAASVQAIINTGLTPVFCDIDPRSLNLDPNHLAGLITPETRIVMPVHYRGEACRMDEILEIAHGNKMVVVEDAAHALGSSYKGRPIGSFGDITCLSLDHIKNITAVEGGVVTTGISEIAEVIDSMRNLGFRNKQVMGRGFRYHMPDFNSAVALTQLSRFEAYKTRRREIAQIYQTELASIPGIELLDIDLDNTIPFFYVTLVLGGKRDDFRRFMNDKNIETLVRYDPNHTQPFFVSQFGETCLPVTERTYQELVVLPLFYELTDDQLRYIIDRIKEFFA